MGGIVCRVRYSAGRTTESVCLFEEWSFLEFLTDYDSWGRRIPDFANIGGLIFLLFLSFINKQHDFTQSYIVSTLLVGLIHCLAPLEYEERYYQQELNFFNTLLARILYTSSSFFIIMGVIRDCRRTDFTSFVNWYVRRQYNNPRGPFFLCYGLCFIGLRSLQEQLTYFYYGMGFTIAFGFLYLAFTTFCFHNDPRTPSSPTRSRLTWSLVFCCCLLGLLYFFADKNYSHFYGQYFYGTNWRLFNVITRSFWFEFSLLVVVLLPTYRELFLFYRRKKKTINSAPVIAISEDKKDGKNQKNCHRGEHQPIFFPVFHPHLAVPLSGMYRCSSHPNLFPPSILSPSASMPSLNHHRDPHIYYSKN